jgi:hypothetical protein
MDSDDPERLTVPCYFLAVIFLEKILSFTAFLEGWLGSETLGCFKCLDNAVNLSWIEAHQQCENIGGFLAEPRTGR